MVRGGLGRHPLVPVSGVPRDVGGLPVVLQVFDELQPQIRRRRVVRKHVGRGHACGHGLTEHRVAAMQVDRTRIVEPTNPVQTAEVVIEGPVFLHHEDDVLDIGERARLVVRRQGQSLAMLSGSVAATAPALNSWRNERRSIDMNYPRMATCSQLSAPLLPFDYPACGMRRLPVPAPVSVWHPGCSNQHSGCSKPCATSLRRRAASGWFGRRGHAAGRDAGYAKRMPPG